MSTFRREFTDAALTRTLDHWLDEGPTSAPDLTVEAALRTVATTRQRQLRGRLLRMADSHGPAVPVSLTVAGLSAVVLVAIGLGLNNEPVPGVEDSPPPGVATEEPVPIEIPDGYVMFRNEADGYELAVPRGWDMQVDPADGEPRQGVTRFLSDLGEFRSSLVISIGSVDGNVFLCRGAACHYEVAASLDEIEVALRSAWPIDTLQEQIVATTLDGEAARLLYPRARSGGSAFLPGMIEGCSAFALHGDRPVVLTLSCNQFRSHIPAGLPVMEVMIETFRFLDEPAPSPSTEASDQASLPSGFELFRNETDGYEVLVHRTWDLAVEPAYGEPRPGVSRFDGASFTGRSPLVISVGSPGGSVYLCESTACHSVVAGNMTVLEAEIKETWQPDSLGERFSEVTHSTVLGGEHARFRYPTTTQGGSTMGVPGVCSAYAFHDGRPVVLTFNCDYFRGGQPALMGTMQTIIESFRFLDPNDAVDPGWQRLSFPDAGFAVEMPLGFSSLDHGDPYWETIAGAGGGLTVRSGDAQNRVHVGSEPRSANTIDDLVAIVAEEFLDLRALASPPEIATEAIDLGGDPAARVTLTPRPGETSPELTHFGTTAQHVLAIHGGRPYIITWIGEYERTFRELLAKFEFLD